MIKRIDHVGITVPELEPAVAFLIQALGCKELHRLGPFSATDDWMTRSLGVHRDAVIPEIVFLDCGEGTRLEVFCYDAPDQQTALPKNSDIGGHHVAFYVDDLDEALAKVMAHGGEVMGNPTFMVDGPSQGETWVYFRAPWGMQMELVTRQ